MKYLRLDDAIRRGGLVPERVAELVAAEIVVPRHTVEDLAILSYEQLDELMVAHLLLDELGVNIEGIEVILSMRQRQIALLRRLNPAKDAVSVELASFVTPPAILVAASDR